MTVAAEPLGPRFATTREHGLLRTLVLGAFAAILAWVLAQVGLKIAFAGIAGIGFICTLVLVRDRERLTLFVGVLSLVAILHKSFSGIEHVSSGPPSLYINTVDVIVLLLYAMWFASGTLRRDLLDQIKRPVIYMPLIAMLFMLPSLLVASTPTLSIAELLRDCFEWLVLVYVAARVRRRSDVWLVLSALAVTVVLEFVVVLGQWATHGPLGLSFLGTPETLNQRVTDTESLGRPFGTITHPVFMAAFLGPLALLSFCLAIHLRRKKHKVVALAFAAMATAPMAISHTRSAALGLVIAGAVVVVATLATRRLRMKVLLGWTVAALMGALIMWNQIMALYHDNFHTQHFSLEVDARGQLYSLGWRMFDAHPVFGTGLNNFQQVMEKYNHLGLIFDGNPVHNLFLLQASETGLIGLIALPLAGLPVLFLALRVARSRDRLYGAIGTAVAAMFVFFIVEEMFVFSLRQDHPRTLFWLLAGLVASCARLMERPEELGDTLDATPPRPQLPSAARRVAEWDGVRPRRRWLRPLLHRWSRTARAARERTRTATVSAARLAPRVAGWAGTLAGLPWAKPVTAGRAVARGTAAAAILAVTPLARVTDPVVRLAFRHRWIAAAAAGVALMPLLVSQPPAVGAIGTAPVAKIVFAAQDRSPDSPDQLLDRSGIYVMNPDGSDLHLVVGDDGLDYSWSKWALGGSKIVFAAHKFGTLDADQIYVMNADGTDVQRLTFTTWTTGQPSISLDGRYLLFTAQWPEFPKFAIYRLDLQTMLVSNVSANESTSGGTDADPRYSWDGSRIVYARSTSPAGKIVPTQIWQMRADGTGASQVTHDTYYNTDPQLSPNGRFVALSSYRGSGSAAKGDPSKLHAKPVDWFIVVRDMTTGAERVLNRGESCATRTSGVLCAPDEGAAFNPSWAPDNSQVGYLMPMSPSTTCICATDADGSDPHVILATQLRIQYFDWEYVGPSSHTPLTLGARASSSRLLFLGGDGTGNTAIYSSGPDRWVATQLGRLPTALSNVSSVRWSPDRSLVLFSATTPHAHVPRPPAPPPGHHRILHYTLGILGSLVAPLPARANVDRTQTFIMRSSGVGLVPVTSGSTEDWHDAIPDGQWRGNVQPDLSPDGRHLVVVNLSSTTNESFLLRINLRTGGVYNLTNATAGAMPVTDFSPRYSPDGRRIAFATIENGLSRIAVIDSRTGKSFRYLTNDLYYNTSPTWSPNGRFIVYASYRGTKPVKRDPVVVDGKLIPQGLRQSDWYLVRIDTKTGAHRVLTTAADSPTFSPVYSPDGKQIAYISMSHPPRQPDIYTIPSGGGPPQPVQITLRTRELSLDWR